MATYSFNMTAGNLLGLGFGYANAAFAGSQIGSISAEPISGQTLLVCASGASPPFLDGTGVSFQGNLVSLLAGHTLWVNGVERPPNIQDWIYNAVGNTTEYVNSTTSTFSNGNTYAIEIKDSAALGVSTKQMAYRRRRI